MTSYGRASVTALIALQMAEEGTKALWFYILTPALPPRHAGD
jgi:hypothetical protein